MYFQFKMTNLYDAMDFCDSILIFIAFHVLWSPQCICICNSDANHFSENIYGAGKKYNAGGNTAGQLCAVWIFYFP